MNYGIINRDGNINNSPVASGTYSRVEIKEVVGNQSLDVEKDLEDIKNQLSDINSKMIEYKNSLNELIVKVITAETEIEKENSNKDKILKLKELSPVAEQLVSTINGILSILKIFQ